MKSIIKRVEQGKIILGEATQAQKDEQYSVWAQL